MSLKKFGLSDLINHYDALFCDVWGVLHNGRLGHKTAIDALRDAKAMGKAVILVTNAPRPSSEIAAEIAELGVTTDIYDAIVTSGDATRDLIRPYEGQSLFRLGPESDGALFEGIAVQFGPLDKAQAIICTDLEYGRTPEDYSKEVLDWKRRGLPFICANPDKVVEVGDELIYCGGALADVYEQAGGEVRLAGKPYAPIYQRATRLAAEKLGEDPAPNRTLAIGDSIRTDATGAAQMGYDFLFISGSIHAQELGDIENPDLDLVTKLVAQSDANTVGYAPRLYW
ncbi:TIGR01459 family HAD-type hydrolase [Maritalea mediterranea]|uniref:TIGR01459 family HAD-type hydrolase n=1 Tax=Maritalea mediterranea TaxID=2909667 RepID=A0ABS9E4I8_9HYPH|nr:TIGR01459 family HAD-type hydrolase [Maritalea mediterranea]MCF4097766.1 TIGR01459 family HAD-type hydrolase [Maritalea mediterranea]